MTGANWLFIDAGNTRIKWGVKGGGAWLAFGAGPKDDVAALAGAWAAWIGPGTQAAGCNVAGEGVGAELASALTAQRVSLRWLAAVESAAGVTNGYDRPRQLGADRWAALVGAWTACGAACLVVNAGTALTVDALDDGGRFLGGLIAPGVRTMLASLARDTAGLTDAPGRHAAFPTCTADAMTTGALDAAAGAVERARARLESRCGHAVPIVLSGGGGPALHPLLTGDVRSREHLVLEGVNRLATEGTAS